MNRIELRTGRSHRVFVYLALAFTGGCGAHSSSGPGSGASGRQEVWVGETSQAAVEAAFESWRHPEVSPNQDASRALGAVDQGAEVDVFFGTWCGDSRREVARLFAALNVAGPVRFRLRWIAVDRAKRAEGYTEHVDLRYVPTVIVRRGGTEVGRIVESSPNGIESDLLGLLNGSAHGILTQRIDL